MSQSDGYGDFRPISHLVNLACCSASCYAPSASPAVSSHQNPLPPFQLQGAAVSSCDINLMNLELIQLHHIYLHDHSQRPGSPATPTDDSRPHGRRLRISHAVDSGRLSSSPVSVSPAKEGFLHPARHAPSDRQLCRHRAADRLEGQRVRETASVFDADSLLRCAVT